MRGTWKRRTVRCGSAGVGDALSALRTSGKTHGRRIEHHGSSAWVEGDLTRIEEDPARWRDVADTVITHVEDLVRVGYFDQAWLRAATVVVGQGREAADAVRSAPGTPREAGSVAGNVLARLAALANALRNATTKAATPTR